MEKTLEEPTSLGFAASEVLDGIPRSYTSTSAVYGNGEATTLHIELELGTTVFERSYDSQGDIDCRPTVGVEASTHFYTEDGIWDQWLSSEFQILNRRFATMNDGLAPDEVGGDVVERFHSGPDTGQLVGVSFLLNYVDQDGDGIFGVFGAGSAYQDMGGGQFRKGSDGYAHVRFGDLSE